ncbi:MAG: ACP S-malonyltransferase [Planctomycetaceae bacterium]
MSCLAFLFPGQGAQHVGMGRVMADKYPAARALYDQAAGILGYDLAELCFHGPDTQLNTTAISQPALLVTSMAAVEMLRVESPDAVANCALCAGLSLGEFSALVFADAMTFEDALRVVKCRGEAMQAAADTTPSGMVSLLLLDLEQVQEICDEASSEGRLKIANFLCPGNLVLSGDQAACDRALELAELAGGRGVKLAVAGAFHTEIMCPADEQLAHVLNSVEIRPPRIPVISNVDAKSHDDPDVIRGLLVRQMISSVRWEDSVRNLLDRGADAFYEVGPGKVLRGLLRRIHRKVTCTSANDS